MTHCTVDEHDCIFACCPDDVFEVGANYRIEDHACTGAAGDAHDLRSDVVQADLQNVGKACLRQFVDLFAVTGNGDRGSADGVGNLHRQPDTARRCQQNHEVALPKLARSISTPIAVVNGIHVAAATFPVHAGRVLDHSAGRSDDEIAVQALFVEHDGRDNRGRIADL